MEHISSFQDGIQKDITKAFIKPSHYKDARNITLNTQGLDSSFAITNPNGNTSFVTIPSTSNVVKIQLASGVAFPQTISFNLNGEVFNNSFNSYQDIVTAINTNTTPSFTALNIKAASASTYILIYGAVANNLTTTSSIVINSPSSNLSITANFITAQTNLIPMGWGLVRDDIILATTNETSQTPSGTVGQLWKLTYDQVTLIPVLVLLYNNFVDFSTFNSFRKEGQSEGRYENSTTKNFYWTDNYNTLRRFNTADPNGFALDPSLLDIKSATDFDVPVLQKINDSGGNTSIGIYQCAYKLKNTGGASTHYSKCSNIVSIINGSPATTGFSLYVGAGSTTTKQPKTITWSIDNVDTDFDRIEVVVLFREQKDDVPVIDTILNEPIPSSGTFTFTYTGFETPDPVDLNTFLENTSAFTHCKTITSKDNLLIAGNTRNVTFDVDFDARAYRFPHISSAEWVAGQNAVNPLVTDTTTLKDSQGGTIAVNSNSGNPFPNQWGVPEEHDAINPDQYSQTINSYRFQRDGITHGGSGVNINYKFKVKFFTGDDVGVNTLDGNGNPGFTLNTTYNPYGYNSRFTNTNPASFSLNNNSFPNNNMYDSFKSEYISSAFKGYQHDEIVPFAIRFYDRQGRPGFAKWIADIRMPLIYEALAPGSYTKYATTDRLGYLGAQRIGILIPEFTVTIPTSLQDKISGWEIVRCERGASDKSILAAGVLQQVYYDSTGNRYFTTSPLELDAYVTAGTVPSASVPMAGSNTTHGKACTFISPEFQFLKFPGYQTGDKLKVVSNLNLSYFTSAQASSFQFGKFYDNSPLPVSTTGPHYEERVLTPNGAQYLARAATNAGTSVDPGLSPAANIQNYQNKRGGDVQTLGDASLFLEWHGSTDLPWTNTRDKFYAYYVRPKTSLTTGLSPQYGGNTFSQRSNRQYISCGHYQEITNLSNLATPFIVEIAGGDIFVNIFDTQKIIKNWNIIGTPAQKTSVTLFFPVESVLNTEWRYGLHVNHSGLPNGTGGADNGEDYLINLVHSSEDNTKKAFPKPIDFIDIQENDNRIYASGFKINGEVVDSWGIFAPLDYIDADGQYGPINNLQILKGNIYGLQDRGVFHLPVNQRVTIPDNSNSTVLLGTGDKLIIPSYLTTSSGCKHQWGNIVTGKGLYYFDINNFKLNRIIGIEEEISVFTGLDSYFKTNLTGDIKKYDKPGSTLTTPYGILTAYDKNNHEILFTFKDNGLITNETIAFNELANQGNGAFTSFYDFFPRFYINDGSRIITSSSTNPSQLWMHGTGNPGQYYGVTYESSIELLIYPKDVKEFVTDNIEFDTEVTNLTGINIFNETWTQIRVYNDYQNSDFQTLIPGSTIKRKKKTWNLNCPRNRVINNPINLDIFLAANLNNNQLFKTRIRGKFILINLKFPNIINATPKRLIMSSLKTLYKPSVR